MNRAQASTVIRVVGAGIAALLVLTGYYLYLEHGTLSNDIPDDHLTASLGAFLVSQPWAAVALIVLVVGSVCYALGVLTGHIGEDAKRWTRGSRLPGLLLAALLLPGCETVQRIADDPSRLCPPNHVLTAEGCVERPPVITQPTPDPNECVCELVTPLKAGCERYTPHYRSYTDPYCRCTPPCYRPRADCSQTEWTGGAACGRCRRATR